MFSLENLQIAISLLVTFFGLLSHSYPPGHVYVYFYVSLLADYNDDHTIKSSKLLTYN
jgi:hypothetical protein